MTHRPTATHMYRSATALWGLAAAWVAFGPVVAGMPSLVVGAAVTTSVMAVVLDCDERDTERTRLSFWAGTVHGSMRDDARSER